MNKKNHIKNYVINEIIGQRLKTGDKLLSERKMAEALGVSRVSVRLALKELSFSNWIESRRGSGYYMSGYGSYDALFLKGLYKINSTTIEGLDLDSKNIISDYFPHLFSDNNKSFLKKYFDKDGKLQILTINFLNKDFSFYLNDKEIQYGFVQALLNHKIDISHSNKSIKFIDKSTKKSKELGWFDSFPVIYSSLWSGKEIIEKSIILMHKDIFSFEKKIIF